MIDIFVFAALADEAAAEAGVETLFHAMPAAIVFEQGSWRLQICTKSGVKTVRSKLLIDATGDANGVGLAGFELVGSEILQPASLIFRCSGYNPDELDYAALKTAAEAAVESGELLSTDVSCLNQGPEALLRRGGWNVNHIRAPRAHTSEGRSLLEIEGRKALLRMYRFFRRQPGLRNFSIDWVCPEAGVRETVTIKGKTTITTADYESGRFFDDAVCYAFYNIDEHLNDGEGTNKRPLKKGIIPTIPRGALLPEGSRFLIAAGRSVSSDREANSALRVQCPCMAMGQAAGALAAISSRTGGDPGEIPIGMLYNVLRKHAAIIPGELSGDFSRGAGKAGP